MLIVTAPMAVSFGKVDITPSIGSALGGYAVDSPRLATGTRLPLWARCLILWDNGSPNVIVGVDVLAFGRALHQSIRSRVVALGALSDTSDFVLAATHTHNGPVLPEKLDPFIAYNMSGAQITPVQTYANQLADKIVNLVSATLAAQQRPCTLDYQVQSETFSGNRELPGSYVETDVPILVARDPATALPLAVLFGYGCHPVAAGRQTLVDPDFPGVAVNTIERNGGPFALYLTGPAGDQNPGNILANPSGGTFADADGYGTDLAGIVSTAARTAGRAVSGPIITGYQEVTLPLDITTDPNNLAVVRSLYVNRQNGAYAGYVQRHAQTMIGEIDANSFVTSLPLPQQVWRLAGAPDLRFAFCGGEVISGYGVYFRNVYGGSDNIWFTGYANEIPCYIPSDGLCRLGGIYYACGFDTDYPGIAGGALTVYPALGHLLYRADDSSTVTGVEQVVINGLTDLINVT
jgi:hypothetical protein